MIILTSRMCRYLAILHFLMTNVLQQQLLCFFTWSSNQLLKLNIFSFFRIFTYELDFSVLPSTGWLANLFLSFWLFLVLFWMLWMLATVLNPCHVPHTLRITTWRTLFTERLFIVSKEWVRSWLHASLIIYHKTFTKKVKAVRPKSCRGGEKEQKKKKGNCKALCIKAQTTQKEKEKERQLDSVMR